MERKATMKLKCDWRNCNNPAFLEVDWDDKSGKWWWSNLCLPHSILELVVKRKKMGYCLSQVWYSHFWDAVWKVACKLLEVCP
jgi:hypothetical protein